MKLTKYTLMMAIGASLALTSCEDVSEADRYIPYEKPDASKNLLIMEFTGMRCVNCPKGAEAVHDITEALDGKAVAICLHPTLPDGPGNFTLPIDGLDLRSDVATDIYNEFHPNFPAAMFDFGDISTNVRRWSGVAMKAFAVPSPLNVEVTTDYDESTRKVKAHYKVTFVDNYTDELNLTMYLTEDGIIGTQEGPSGVTYENYTFNHVLRGSFNGTWGESIGSGFTILQEVEGEYELTLKEGWKAENCNVACFVGQPKGTVFNATEAKVKE